MYKDLYKSRFEGGFNPDFYYGDYWQLGFVLTPQAYLAIATQEVDGFIDIRVHYIKLYNMPRNFETFVLSFLHSWQHEYWHIIGMSHADMEQMEKQTIIL